MKTNKGISLIVLVITIIVMIILAGAIILSLNNAGIIGRANEAVDKTNEATVRQLAELKWAEAYLNPEIDTDKEYREAVINGLEAEGIDAALYDITSTTSGVSVEKLTTVTELQETHTFEYYSSLSGAIADVNAGTIGKNLDANKSNAVAGVYTDDGSVNVVLLKDATETAGLILTKSMTLNLGGNTLTFAEGVAMGIKANGDDAKITIDGRLSGSTIIVNGANQGTRGISTTANTFTLNGGTYIVRTVTNTTNATFSVRAVMSRGILELNNAKMYVDILLESVDTVTDLMNGAVIQAVGDLSINNSVLEIKTLKDKVYRDMMLVGVQASNTGTSNTATIKDSTINVTSNVTGELPMYSCGLLFGGFGGGNGEINAQSVTVSGCNINVTADYDGNKACGIDARIGENEIIDTDITANAKTEGIGVENSSYTTLTSCTVSGSTLDIKNNATLYVDGKEYGS